MTIIVFNVHVIGHVDASLSDILMITDEGGVVYVYDIAGNICCSV